MAFRPVASNDPRPSQAVIYNPPSSSLSSLLMLSRQQRNPPPAQQSATQQIVSARGSSTSDKKKRRKEKRKQHQLLSSVVEPSFSSASNTVTSEEDGSSGTTVPRLVSEESGQQPSASPIPTLSLQPPTKKARSAEGLIFPPSSRLRTDAASSSTVSRAIHQASPSAAMAKKIEALEEEVGVLQRQLSVREEELREEREAAAQLSAQLEESTVQVCCLRGDEEVLRDCSLEDCLALAEDLSGALRAVDARKMEILDAELRAAQEARLCAVCLEEERAVVLLPCRHLCLCQSCSGSTRLSSCPICRQKIAERIPIFT